MYGYVYKTTNLINKKIYIGKHKTDKQTIDINYLGSGIHLTRAIKKYGKENFICEVLEWCSTLAELNKREKYWITYFNSRDISIGYNIAEGGDGGMSAGWNKGLTNIYSEEAKQKMREAKEGKPSWNKGKTNIYSKDTREKMRDAKKTKKVVCVETQEVFNSSWEACEKKGFDVSQRKKINRCCNKHRKEAFGYHWCYLEKEES